MASYDHKKIEKKWQKVWLTEKIFEARDDSKKEKYYQLETFPYPSGAGLHVGHPKGYIAEDIHARYMRMQGKEVLYTMGWDAFGLPTENYAIKVGKSPKEVAVANTEHFKKQVQMFGLSYDWDREINTSAPEYYKWTQWLFIQLFKKGLAYRAKAKVNWCPKDQTVLANEQVVNGKCERCGSEIEERDMEQWFFKITDYTERLLTGLKGLDWPPATVKRQEDWIGKSEGAEISFPIKLSEDTNFIILHGFTGLPTNNFIPWLKKELENRGHKVQAPKMPNTNHPTEDEQVGYVLKNCRIDTNTVLIGHSLGGVVAIKVLQKYAKPIAGLVLVAPAVAPEFRTGTHKHYWDTFSWHFNYDQIKKLSPLRIVLSDLQEKKRIAYLEFLSKELSANLVTSIAKEEHFCALEEPIILDNLLPKVKVFTTRPDTLFGATYMVLAPEHELISNLKSQISNFSEVGKYVEATSHKTDLMRQETVKEKTGVELKGVSAINPATEKEIPIWIADYVLGSYGTGAIMAVPAHDERDYEFAKKFNLPIRYVIDPVTGTEQKNPKTKKKIVALVEDKRGNILTVNWGPLLGGRLLIGGTVEDGEDPEKTAIREIAEETGYQDLTLVEIGEESVHHRYFAHSKQQAFHANTTPFHFQLKSERHDQQKLEDNEKGKFKIEWVSVEQARREVTDPLHRYVFDKFIEGKFYAGVGVLANSGEFTGMDSERAKWEITKFVDGTKKTQYRLRDWSVSRQRYWGVPIPMIHCRPPAGGCGIVPVLESELPVLLPDIEDYRPRGMPPLASSKEFINVACPKCGGEAQRDAETLDTFVDSSWYYLRYTDPHNSKEIFSKQKVKHWMPVDLYVIGAEHTVLHLLYSRFITKFLHDEGWLNFDEPFLSVRHVGLIRGADGQKMSKSKGNVVNPDTLIEEFGADTLRLYEMFMGPFEDGAPWDPKGILGMERFLNRFWNMVERSQISNLKSQKDSLEVEKLLHKTIKKVGEDIESLHFNTAISALMILLNEFEKLQPSSEQFRIFFKLIAPFAPHMAEEIWRDLLKEKSSIHIGAWPAWDPKMIVEDTFTLVVQVNGKVRDSFDAPIDISEAEVKRLTLTREKVRVYLANREPKKVIYVPKRLVNVVI